MVHLTTKSKGFELLRRFLLDASFFDQGATFLGAIFLLSYQMNPLQPTLSRDSGPIVAKDPRKKYEIIYADPPWKYRSNPKVIKPWMASAHYPTVDTDTICNMKVADIAAKNACLFLWTTFPRVFEAQKVIQAWGFEYATVAFVWIKANNPHFPNHWIIDPKRYPFPVHWGKGSWTKSNAEVCLLGLRGKPQRHHRGIHQLIYQPVGRHSQKPGIVRKRIVQLAGDRSRIELFARQKVTGWHSWGNEVDSDIELTCG